MVLTRRESCASATLSTTHSAWIVLRLIVVPRGERPATHLLNCVMVIERLSYELHEEQLSGKRGGSCKDVLNPVSLTC